MSETKISDGAGQWAMYERLKVEDPQAAAAYWRSNQHSMIAYGRRAMDAGYMGLFGQSKVKTAARIQAEVFEKELEVLKEENASLKDRIEELNNQLLQKDIAKEVSDEEVNKRVDMLLIERLASQGVSPLDISLNDYGEMDDPLPANREDALKVLKNKLKRERQ